MSRRGIAAIAVAVASLLPAACARRGPRAASRASVVALVGENPVEYTDFAAYVKAASGEEPVNVSPKVASSLFDQYLEELLMERAIEDEQPKLGGATSAERRRELISRRARLDAITEKELRADYDAHPDRYRRPSAVRLSQLLFATREAAEVARKKLAAGVGWAEVSRELSSAPNAASGGSLGLLALSDIPREFEKAIWSLPPGGITPILAAPHGFHVFLLEERFDQRTISFEEAAPALRLDLSEQRSLAAAQQIVAAARRAHPIFVIEEHLPFPYVGTLPHFAEVAR